MQHSGSYRNIIVIAIPLMVSNLLQNLVGLIDTRFMGMLSAEDSTPLAAVGVGALFFWILTMVPNGFSLGTQIIAARRDGENQYAQIGELVDNSMVFMVLMGIGLSLLLKVLTPVILPLAFESVAVQEQCSYYLGMRAWEFIPFGVLMTMVAFQAGIGQTKSIMFAAVCMTGSNFVLNYALVFGKWGFPELAIGGAGLASAISTIIGAVVLVVWAIAAGSMSKYELFRFKKFSGAVIRKVTNLSIPVVVQHIAGTAVWLFFFTTIEKMGEDELAISNVIKMVYLTLGVTAWGMGGAVNTLISNLIGQGRHAEVFPVLLRTIWMSVAVNGVFAVLTLMYPQAILGLFVTDRPDLLELGAAAMQVTGVALIMLAVSVCTFRATMGTGATKFTLLIELIVLPLYIFYVVYVVNIRQMNLAWAWGSEFVYWTFLALFCYIYLRTGKWKKLTL